jgi:hypothetical protein
MPPDANVQADILASETKPSENFCRLIATIIIAQLGVRARDAGVKCESPYSYCTFASKAPVSTVVPCFIWIKTRYAPADGKP